MVTDYEAICAVLELVGQLLFAEEISAFALLTVSPSTTKLLYRSAGVAEKADAPDLKSGGVTPRAGSSPAPGTKFLTGLSNIPLSASIAPPQVFMTLISPLLRMGLKRCKFDGEQRTEKIRKVTKG